MNYIKKDNRIFIAGHRGMVGRSIKRSLENHGYKNLLLTDRTDLNLLDNAKVKKWFKVNKPEIVILAAAKVGGIEANNNYPADFILENLKIQTNIIENAWKNGTKRLLFLGSSCIYPKLAKQPLKEEYLLTGPLEQTNDAYAVAKIAGIKLCSSLRKQYGFDAISLMPTNLYGPGDNYHTSNSHVLPALIKKFHYAKMQNKNEVICWGSGSPKREFLYVNDLAEASIFVLEKVSISNESFNNIVESRDGILNIGTGNEISIKELAEMISFEIGYEGEIKWDNSKPDGTPRKLLDISKATTLGWTAKTSLKKGIKLTISHYMNELNSKSIRL